MREIRGAGEQHVEEGGEEEKDFEEDEVIESEAEAVAGTKADEGSNEVKTEAAGGDDEKNQNKAKQEEKEDKKNESSSLNKANSTDSFDAQMVLRRIRGKRTVYETPTSQSVRRKLEFSPTSAESAPAMKASPTSATSASGGSKQKQSTLKRFFSPESVGTEELELEEEPQLPPKKREKKIEDVIRSLLHQGIVNKDGQVVKWTEADMAAIKEATEKKLTNQMVPSMRNRGGRPEVMQELKRGVGGGLKSNRRLKHQKKKRHDLPVSHKHALCQEIFGMREEHKNEEELLMHAAKKFKMKRVKLRYIWNRRSEWKKQMEQHGLSTSEQHVEGRSARRGSHGPGATKVVRMRAKGGGRKLQFPSIYEQIRTWVELERSHCHTVLPRHVGWKFHELLLQYHQELQAKNEQGSISK